MPTIIEKLILQTEIDNSKAKSGADEAEDQFKRTREQGKKTADDLDKNGGGGAKFFMRITAEAAKLLLLFKGASGIEGMIRNLVSSSAQLGFNASNLGLSPDELKRWQNTAERMGGTAEGFVNTLATLSKAETEFNTTGNVSEPLKWLRMLGVSMQDGSGKLRDYSDILTDLHNKFMGLEAAGHDRRELFNVGASLGIDQGTLNLLLLGNKEFEREIALQKQIVHGQDAASKAALRLQQHVKELQQRFNQWAQDVMMRVEPKIEHLLDLLNEFGEWVKAHPDIGAVAFAALGIAAASAILPMFVLKSTLLKIAASIGVIEALFHPDWSGIATAGVDAAKVIRDAWANDTNAMRGDLAKLKDDLKSLWSEMIGSESARSLSDLITPGRRLSNLKPDGSRDLNSDTASTISDSYAAWRKESRINAMVQGVDHPEASADERKEANRRIQKKREEAEARPKSDTGWKWLDSIIDSFANFGDALDTTTNQLVTTSGMIDAINTTYYQTGSRNVVTNKGGNSSTTNVQVDKIEVNTSSSDPRTHGVGVADAMRRKLIVGQANSGMD